MSFSCSKTLGFQLRTLLTFRSMFYHLLYIHLFRPFLKYNPATSPLPSHVSPRKLCTQAASLISKLMRLYKRTYGLRQICNIAVYMVHSACTIHLLNLPEKTAKRDIVHGVKHLEEIAEDWLCARRTLSILSVLARKWKIELPEEASTVLARTDAKYGTFSTADVPSPKSDHSHHSPSVTASSPHVLQVSSPQKPQNQYYVPDEVNYMITTTSMSSNGLLSTVSTNANNTAARSQIMNTPTPSTRANGTMSVAPESAMQLTSPYPQHQPYLLPESGASSVTQTQSAPSMASSAPSPSVMFGGVDSLMESQNWWLRDQASLAVGFDNWGGMGVGDGSGMAGVGSGFFMPGNGSGSLNASGYGDEEWFN
jgi:hypothetical protein